ncbi:MAG TPA: DinB family protein [Chloroflexota bacterium]|jgi:uncharacterized damage-inducible protein DinB|nr:DinB family protein [Chloroflexota bacterium]
MTDVHTLHLMFQHNDWANRRVRDLLAGLDNTVMGDDAKGTVGSIEQTVKHLVGVEEVYLSRIQGKDPFASGSREDYFAHNLEWFWQRALDVARDYAGLLVGADEQLLEQPLAIPWIAVPLTVREGLIQVLTHSAQHRAQILSTLGEQGRKVPDMDFVVMRLEQQAQESGQAAKA